MAEQLTVDAARAIFNEMAGEYDSVHDLWYSYLFSRIDSIIEQCFSPTDSQTVLDVGCGTGIQSLTFARMGYRVTGIDIAEDLVRIAERKLTSWRYLGRATFLIGDAQSLPLPDAEFDVVNCCGSTINFVPDPQQALREMARVLRRGGRLILECDQRWHLDVVWEVVSALLGNIFEYDETLGEALSHFSPPLGKGYCYQYAFRGESGKCYMRVRCFTPQELQSALAEAGFRVDRTFGIHCLTNLIPSTVLHNPAPAPAIRRLFRTLAWCEGFLYDRWPFSQLGNSLVVIATRL